MSTPAQSADTTRHEFHYLEYLCEAFGLGLFMVSASGFAVLLFHPASPVPRALPNPMQRGALMGLAMAMTALINIYSPWGRRSGAHLNPSVTLTFLRLGKVGPADAAWYIAAQFLGGIGGMILSWILFRDWIGHPSVNYVATLPGPGGILVAFVAELLISFGLMLTVLNAASRPQLAPLTGVLAATLVGVYIALEAPLSGMSMNPARTFGSAVVAWRWTALWLYFTAPPAGMLLAAEVFGWGARRRAEYCAKMYHLPGDRCIFCEYRSVARSLE
ncbi:MAG: aquaporin [Gemmatimonadota bacterium]